jgi:radical SAM protein with 4Fe4S-binding SPASM domain
LPKKPELKGLFIEITNKCHMYCRHCSSEASASNKEYIPPEQLFKLIDQGIPLGLKHISLSGGEPLLYPELFSILEYAKQLNLETCIYSCGIMEHSCELGPIDTDIISGLKKLNIRKIIFSIHGATDDTHDYITQTKGSFRIALESIKKSLTANLPTEIHMVPMKVNFKEIPKLIELADTLGVNQVSLLRLVPQGRCKEQITELLLNETQTKEMVTMVRSLETKFTNTKIRLGAPFNCVNWDNITPCSASKNKLLISATGEIFPCEAFKWLKGTRNKIYDYTLKDLWVNDQLMNQLRNFTPENIEFCSDCQMLTKCQGGCPGQRMLLNGSIYVGPEFLCQLSS